MNKILFIDTATTGMNSEKCAIYRLGGIYTEDGIEKSRFEFRMRPFINARINEQSLWISGETRASLQLYQDEKTAFNNFLSYINQLIDLKNPRDKAYIAGFNAANRDVPFIREWFRRNGNERFRDYFYVQVLDLMCISAFGLINIRNTMPDFHLETAARFLQVRATISEKYNSINNAKICLDMYRTLQKRFCIGECVDTRESTEIIKNF